MFTSERVASGIYGGAFLAATGLAATLESRGAFDPLALALLLAAFACASVLMPIDRGPLKISATFVSVMLAAAFLGPLAAASIGVLSMLVNRLATGQRNGDLIANLATWAWFPLLAGLAFDAAYREWGLRDYGLTFALTFMGIATLALALNFVLIALYTRWVEATPLREQARDVLLPVLPSELASVVLGATVAMLYAHAGLSAIALIGVVLGVFQHLVASLLAAHDRSKQLASLTMGVISGMVSILDLRDHMTARHSAAVARYSRELARAAGLSREAQELVHTAGLLHDIGKFIFPDHILKGEVLQEGDWEIIKQHPAKGADVLWRVEGYGPVAAIVLCHHERIDGLGYPNGLAGEDIPELSRILAVADAYDVMTARSSYKRAYRASEATREEALAELERCAGSQFDARFVETLCRLVRAGQVEFEHGLEADFDQELALEKRIRDLAGSTRLVPGVRRRASVYS